MKHIKLLLALLLVSACAINVPTDTPNEVPTEPTETPIEVPTMTFEDARELVMVYSDAPSIITLMPNCYALESVIHAKLDEKVESVLVRVYYYDEYGAQLTDSYEDIDFIEVEVSEEETIINGFYNPNAEQSQCVVIGIKLRGVEDVLYDNY